MSGNPYATNFDDAGTPKPERTSGLAIASLVLSLTCCLSPVGLVLGIISLVLIGGSGGRLKGQGMALAAVVVGLVLSVLLGAALYGASQVNSLMSGLMFSKPDAILTALEADDFNAVRAELEPPLDAMTDEQLTAFREGYRAAYGPYVSVPESFIDSLAAYGSLGPSMQNYQGAGNVMPIPAEFLNGPALVVLDLMTGASPTTTGPTPVLPISDMVIVMPDGTELRLSEFASPPAPTPVPPTDPEPAGENP